MRDYDRIERLVHYIVEHRSTQPDLDSLAREAGISRFHLQRLFTEWAGISPKTFLKCLNLAHAKALLDGGESVLDTALDSGLSGPSRLHDLCVSIEAASPGEIKSGGKGWTITAGFAESPFGTCLVASNSRGICHLSFVPCAARNEGANSICADWPNAEIHWNDDSASALASSVFVRRRERHSQVSFRAFVRGTEFQIRVWRALLEIPDGSVTSYSRIAESIQQPTATRAVASAIGKNSLAFLIPCHRVIRETGVIGEYRWGSHRKMAMMAWETGDASTHEPTTRNTIQ